MRPGDQGDERPPRPGPEGLVDVASVLVAPDKFRGTATAAQAAEAMARGASALGWSASQLPLADGGEGLLDALGSLGGERRTVEVEGPLGRPVAAEWLLVGNLAVVEMAQASGLLLAGGAAGNDPLGATTRGTGQLIVAAARAARWPPPVGRTVPTVPRRRWSWDWAGSATTDGGRGALAAVEEAGGTRGCDPGRGLRRRRRLRRGRRPVRPSEGRRTRPRWSSSPPGSRTWPVATGGATGSTCGRWRGPGPPVGWVEPSPSSAAASGRATTWSPSCWASTGPWPPARPW